MVNLGLLAAEIVSLVWGTPANFNGFRNLAALLHGTQVVGSEHIRAVCMGVKFKFEYPIYCIFREKV